MIRLPILATTVFLLTSLPAAAHSDDARRYFGQIEGRVVTTDDAPVLGAEVGLDPRVIKTVSTDSEGLFTLRAVPEGSYRVIAAAPGFAVGEASIEVSRESPSPALLIRLPAAEVTLDSIDVVGSYSIGRDAPARSSALTAEQLRELPHFGDDIVRAVTVLPGVTSNDASAEFNVRGSLTREVRYEIDGLEIFEPYHLKDYQNIFSIIDPEMLGGVDFFTGGFPVEYGDRSAAVLDLETFSPDRRAHELGLSLLNAWGSTSGRWEGGSYFASARRGWFDIVLDLVGEEESEDETRRGRGPTYWDVLSKVSFDLGPRQDLAVQVLLSSDSNDEFEREREEGGFEEERTDSSYGNSYLWARHNAFLGKGALVETMLSTGRVDRDRRTAEESPSRNFEIRDERTLDVLQGRQDLTWQVGDEHLVKSGWEARRYQAEYDYFNQLALIDVVASAFGVQPITRFAGTFESDHLGLYLADRWKITPRFVIEAGARWDRHSLTDEDHISPRINGLLDFGSGWRGRFAWGHFYQSQRPNELQVEDGETTFLGAERAEHRILGLERTFGARAATWEVRLEGYQRLIEDPRPRFENVFQTFVLNPETANDRTRIAPESAEARGVELFLTRRGGGTFDWWINYAWSEATDTLDGREVLRATDQTHAVNLAASWRPSPRWSFNAVWIYHTGWPTTPVSARLDIGSDGETIAVPVIGELRSDRLDDYHRLDVRASRRFTRGRAVWEFFIDVQNLYNRRNDAGVELDGGNFLIDDQGQAVYRPSPEKWFGLLPSFGISWTF
ncbi:MAG: TonB-dependent receptor [Thermoanaerobaculia bacterium]|nr:TonB-dependent receptor [Thermoanaerobaculia bacterium]